MRSRRRSGPQELALHVTAFLGVWQLTCNAQYVCSISCKTVSQLHSFTRSRMLHDVPLVMYLVIGQTASRLREKSPAPRFPLPAPRSPTSDLRPPTSDLRPPLSDLRPPTSDLRPPLSDLRPPPRMKISRQNSPRRAAAKPKHAKSLQTGIMPGHPVGSAPAVSAGLTNARLRPDTSQRNQRSPWKLLHAHGSCYEL